MQRANAWLLTVGLLISSVAAGMVALQRLKVEQANRAVELVLDYPDVALWASADGKTVSQWLSGFNTPFSVALTEGLLTDWGAPLPEPTPTYLLSEARFQQAKRMLALKAQVVLSPPAEPPYVTVRSERGGVFYVIGEPSAIAQIGLGLDPLQAAQVRAGGKPLVARLFNPQGVSPLALRGSLMLAREQGATLIIFAGDQVLGYRRGLQATAQNMQANALRFGAIEFARQMGAGNLMQAMPERTVRVHSIGLAESLTLSPGEIVDRLERAVQERNIRVLYLRASGADTALLREILQNLSERLDRSGYAIRESGARPFQPLQPALGLFALAGAGVGLLAGWLLTQWRGAGFWALAPFALGVVLALICLFPVGRKLTALAAALLFPTVGMIALAGLAGRPQPQPVSPNAGAARPHPQPLSHGVGEGGHDSPSPTPWEKGQGGKGFLRFASLLIFPFAWSLLGALHIVGLLSETPFLIKADQFTGVKAAHVLPLLFVLVFYAAYARGRWDFWREWLTRPVLWGQMALALVILGAVGLMLIRTGNEAPGAVPDWELRLRALLETVMNVRPRTKEFLIGHPALVVAVGLLLTRRTQWLPLAMFLGAIGQASIVNTFCHLHSPLMVSLQRTAWGILIGVAIGAVVWEVLRRIAYTTRQ